MMRSDDWGVTWTVILNSSQIYTLSGNVDPQAVYSPLWMGDNRWVCNLRSAEPGYHMIESLDDGLTWSHMETTGLTAGSRKMILASDGQIIYGGAFADSSGTTGGFTTSVGSFKNMHSILVF